LPPEEDVNGDADPNCSLLYGWLRDVPVGDYVPRVAKALYPSLGCEVYFYVAGQSSGGFNIGWGRPRAHELRGRTGDPDESEVVLRSGRTAYLDPTGNDGEGDVDATFVSVLLDRGDVAFVRSFDANIPDEVLLTIMDAFDAVLPRVIPSTGACSGFRRTDLNDVALRNNGLTTVLPDTAVSTLGEQTSDLGPVHASVALTFNLGAEEVTIGRTIGATVNSAPNTSVRVDGNVMIFVTASDRELRKCILAGTVYDAAQDAATTGETATLPKLTDYSACGRLHLFAYGTTVNGGSALTFAVTLADLATADQFSGTYTLPDPRLAVELLQGQKLNAPLCTDLVGDFPTDRTHVIDSGEVTVELQGDQVTVTYSSLGSSSPGAPIIPDGSIRTQIEPCCG